MHIYVLIIPYKNETSTGTKEDSKTELKILCIDFDCKQERGQRVFYSTCYTLHQSIIVLREVKQKRQ